MVPGHRRIDPKQDVRYISYKPRSVRTHGPEIDQAFAVVEETWLHTVATPHAQGFPARKEDRMVPLSPQRGLPRPDVVNSPRRFVPGPYVDTSLWNDELRQESLDRLKERNEWVRKHNDKVPVFPKFAQRLVELVDLAEDRRNMMNVVVDLQPGNRGFEDWTFAFHREYGVSKRSASSLSHVAVKEAWDLKWPI